MTYKYCSQMSNRLLFNNLDVTCCTIGNNTKSMQTPYFLRNYRGQNINWDKIFEYVEEVRNNCKKGIYPESCDGCQYFVEEDWDNILPKNPKELVYCQFANWVRCNSDCIFCNNHIAPEKEKPTDLYNSYPILENLLKNGYITKNTQMDFAGGEPSLYYKFSDMLSLLLDADIKKISVHTNAINFNKQIERGIKQGIVSICVSVDAGSKDIHKKVKRVNSYDKVWKHIKKYAKAKNPIYKNCVALKYIIIPELNDKEKELEIFIKKAIDARVDYVILNADNNIFRNRVSDVILNELIYLTEFFIDKCKEYNIKMEISFNIRAAYIMKNKELPNTENEKLL